MTYNDPRMQDLRSAASLPAWGGAWIETLAAGYTGWTTLSRSPRGERGLKLRWIGERIRANRRSPRGERGLKRIKRCGIRIHLKSLLAWGAWIETSPETRSQRS